MVDRLVFALRRLPELTRDEFQRYWLAQHAPLVRECAAALGIGRYQQVHTVADDTTYGGQPFDGVAELWFDGTSTAEALDAAARLLTDERRFIDLTASPILVVREHAVVDGPSDGMRMTTLLYRKADLTHEQFREHWSQVHAPIAQRHGSTLATRRYVQMFPIGDPGSFPPAIERGAPPAPDGVGESYFEPDEIDANALDGAMQELSDDAQRFVDTTRTVSAFGRVETIIA